MDVTSGEARKLGVPGYRRSGQGLWGGGLAGNTTPLMLCNPVQGLKKHTN